jgi:hypothetical protein
MHAHARTALGRTRGTTGLCGAGALGRLRGHKRLSIGILAGECWRGEFPVSMPKESDPPSLKGAGPSEKGLTQDGTSASHVD